MTKNNKYFLLVFLVVSLAFVLRIYKVVARLPFTMDEEYQAFLVREILEGRHLPLIGVNVADTGLYLGPFFTYLATIPYFLFGGSPVGGAIVSALAGGLTTLLLIKVGEKISRPTGLLAGLWYGVAFLSNAWDRKFWNPTFIPLLSVLLLFALLKVKKNRRWWLVVLGIFGAALSTHYSLFLLILPLIFIARKLKLKISRAILIQGSLVLLFCVLPLGLFEVRHNFIQTKTLTESIRQGETFKLKISERGSSLMRILSRFLYVPGSHDLANEISLCQKNSYATPRYPVGFFVIASFLALPWLVKRRQEKAIAYFLVSSFLVTVGAWLLFPKPVSEYYLLPLFPLIFLSLAWTAEGLMNRGSRWLSLGLAGIILGLLIYNTYSVVTMKHSLGLKKKIAMINWVENQVEDGSYTLEAQENCYRFEGYRYLFDHYFKPPVVSYMDPYFSWLYSPEFRGKSLEKEGQKRVRLIFSTDKNERKEEEMEKADFDSLMIEIAKR